MTLIGDLDKALNDLKKADYHDRRIRMGEMSGESGRA
jgi:hypothetical protein